MVRATNCANEKKELVCFTVKFWHTTYRVLSRPKICPRLARLQSPVTSGPVVCGLSAGFKTLLSTAMTIDLIRLYSQGSKRRKKKKRRKRNEKELGKKWVKRSDSFTTSGSQSKFSICEKGPCFVSYLYCNLLLNVLSKIPDG